MDNPTNSARIDADILLRMQRDWDDRAKENARYYVASERKDWTDAEFFESGRASVRGILLEDGERLIRGRDLRTMKVLEIGCGAGRMTRAFAEIVGEIHAVDVSGEMVRRAVEALRGGGGQNAYVYQNDGAGLDVLRETDFDIAISFIVFQHIPEPAVIERYVKDVASRLKPDGVFKAQVQGNPLAVLGRGDTWEGCYVPASTWLRWADQYGLRLADFEGYGTQYLWLWFERTAEEAHGLREKESAFLAAESQAVNEVIHSAAAPNIELARENERLRNRESELAERVFVLEGALNRIRRSWGYRLMRRIGLAPSSKCS